jgi:hypothetical protein
MRIPESIQDKLAPEALRDLVRRLATRVESRRAGVNVALIVQTLLGGELGSGPERAALYQALRDAVRQQIEALPDLRYVQGLS